MWLSNSTPGHLPQKNEKNVCYMKSCTRTFIAPLLIIVKNWKQFRSPSVDEWLNTVVYPYHGMLLSNTEEQTIGMYNVVDRKMRPPQKKDVCCLIPGTSEYVILHGKRDFAGIIKVTDLKIRRYIELLGRSNAVTWTLQRIFSGWSGSDVSEEVREIPSVRGTHLLLLGAGHMESIKKDAGRVLSKDCLPADSRPGNWNLCPTSTTNWIWPTTWMSLEPLYPQSLQKGTQPWFRPCEVLSRGPIELLLHFWPLEMWDNRCALF